MQFKEHRIPPPSGEEKFAGVMNSLEQDLAKERISLKNLWEKTGDVVRDIDTANKMAKDKFDGDSALMHVARGAVTTGVGAGLEKAMDYVWDSVWSGDIPFYDKSKFGSGMAEALNTFALKNDRNARLAYIMKEGTQDLSLAIFYNFLAFRGQPLLPKVESKHLLASLGLDVAEGVFSPNLPIDINARAKKSQTALIESDLKRMRRDISDTRQQGNHAETVNKAINYLKVTDEMEQQTPGLRAAMKSIIDENAYQLIKSETIWVQDYPILIEAMRKEMGIRERDLRKYSQPPEYKPGKIEEFFRNGAYWSNPITHLGAEWMVGGVKTLIENYVAVRKARAEKGGLQGKKVFMPKEDRGGRFDKKPWQGDKKPWEDRKPWQGDRKPWEDRRQQTDRRGSQPPDPDKRVYYGKGKSDDKLLEEYELKGS